MMTAADGSYQFNDLLSGNYTVSAVQAVGYNDGAETAGNFGGSLATNDAISAITVPAGKDGAGYNFGELGMPITGVIFRDDNHDGARDPGEPGLPGVTIQLLDPLTMLPIATVTTRPHRPLRFRQSAARLVHRPRDAAPRLRRHHAERSAGHSRRAWAG